MSDTKRPTFNEVAKKLQECKTCAEAEPYMKALRMGSSQKKLVETAIQLGLSDDNRQKAYGKEFMLTALKEAHDEHEKKIKEDNGGAHRDQGGEADISGIIDKEKEADEITGELDSHQSSDIDMPYPKEGTDAPQSDIESSKTASGENQMGGIKENLPGMMPMGPGMPPMAPDVMQQMQAGGKMPTMPPMNTNQMMRQMQYTVEANLRSFATKYVAPIVAENKKLREAVIALNKKVQEASSLNGTMKLDLEKVKANSAVREHVRETVPGMDGVNFPRPTEFTTYQLQETRREIEELDKTLTKSKDAQIYQ
jgi:hypothetical protein